MSYQEAKRIVQEPNLMTQQAKEILQSKLEKALLDLAEIQRATGEAGGDGQFDWHDNAPLDEVHRQIDMANIRVNTIRQQLVDPVIISSRTEIDQIGLGNGVVLDFGEDDLETIYLLGPADVSARKDELGSLTLSVRTSLGCAILNKKVGDQITTLNGAGRPIQAKIVSILPSNF